LRELSASAASEPVEELELVDAAAQVSAWCGEPLLYDGDDPAITLAPGTARRRALDAAREEMAAGLDAPSPAWRFRFSLMLGLERVLAAEQPALLNGLTLRPHQVDALAGMLAALTAGEEREEVDEAEADDDELNGELNGDELNGDDPPIDELEARLAELPPDAEVVAYCRGPYCVYADDAVRELNRKGYRALRLIDGFPEWKRAGLPIEQGNGREP